MNDRIKYYIFKTFNLRGFSFIGTCYYRLAIFVVKYILSRKNYVEAIYLKGSYLTPDFVPFISDIDFVILSSTKSKKSKELQKTIKSIGRFFPMVSDYDFYDQDEFEIVKRFGLKKVQNCERWMALKGCKLEDTYVYHPFKEMFDFVHEIYFQFEWLERNIKKRSTGDPYRSEVIRRQFIKLLKTLKSDREQDLIKDWSQLSNESILMIFNLCVEKDERVQRNYKKLKDLEIVTYNFQEVLKQDYYKSNLSLILTKNFNIKKHNFTLFLFKLFYSFGCIDNYQLYLISKGNCSQLQSDLIFSAYLQNIIDARFNDNHGRDFIAQGKERARPFSKRDNLISKNNQDFFSELFHLHDPDVEVVLSRNRAVLNKGAAVFYLPDETHLHYQPVNLLIMCLEFLPPETSLTVSFTGKFTSSANFYETEYTLKKVEDVVREDLPGKYTMLKKDWENIVENYKKSLNEVFLFLIFQKDKIKYDYHNQFRQFIFQKKLKAKRDLYGLEFFSENSKIKESALRILNHGAEFDLDTYCSLLKESNLDLDDLNFDLVRKNGFLRANGNIYNYFDQISEDDFELYLNEKQDVYTLDCQTTFHLKKEEKQLVRIGIEGKNIHSAETLEICVQLNENEELERVTGYGLYFLLDSKDSENKIHFSARGKILGGAYRIRLQIIKSKADIKEILLKSFENPSFISTKSFIDFWKFELLKLVFYYENHVVARLVNRGLSDEELKQLFTVKLLKLDILKIETGKQIELYQNEFYFTHLERLKKGEFEYKEKIISPNLSSVRAIMNAFELGHYKIILNFKSSFDIEKVSLLVNDYEYTSVSKLNSSGQAVLFLFQPLYIVSYDLNGFEFDQLDSIEILKSKQEIFSLVSPFDFYKKLTPSNLSSHLLRNLVYKIVIYLESSLEGHIMLSLSGIPLKKISSKELIVISFVYLGARDRELEIFLTKKDQVKVKYIDILSADFILNT